MLDLTPADFAIRSCHIIWNLSAPAACFGNRLDFSGIVLLMWGASIPSIHYAFICDTTLEYLHCFLVSQSVSTTSNIQAYTKGDQVTISASGCIVFTLHPRFLGPAFRKYRALMYASFGMSALMFMSHSIFLYGFAVQRKRLALEWMVLMGALNIVGACFYASRVCISLQCRERGKLTDLSCQRDGSHIASTLSVQVIRFSTCLSLRQVLYITRPWFVLFASHENPVIFVSLATSCSPKSDMSDMSDIRAVSTILTAMEWP